MQGAPSLDMARRLLTAATAALVLLCGLAPRAGSQAPCDAFEVEYALAANLALSDTPFGKGNGVYPVGPGRMVLRFESRGGVPAGTVEMRIYRMHEQFVIHSTALFWKSDFISVTDTQVTPNACAVVARGTLTGHTINWSTPLRAYRIDGQATCRGSLCGKMGAPDPGQTQVHLGPGPVWFKAFDFAPDMQTFTMQSTQVSKSESPKLVASIALSGREIGRSCVAVQPCR
jgi:hypothetical protein